MADQKTDLWNLDDPDLISAIDELPLWSAPFGQLLLETVQYRPGISILDIGSGTGFPALELAQRFGKQSKVVALDPWRTATDRLRHKMQQYRIENLTISNASAEQMPFADSTFDLITSNNCLNNVEDRRRAWQECFRVSKPGAQLVATENLPDTLLEFYGIFNETLRDLNLEECLAGVEKHIYSKRRPIDETCKIVRSSGYELVDETSGRFTLRYVDGTAFLNHSLIRLAFLPSWMALVPEGMQVQVLERAEEKLNVAAKARGSLEMTVPFVCLDCRKAGAL